MTDDFWRLTGSRFWRLSKDGDRIGRALYQRHYSRYVYRDGREPALFVGPGQKMVLIAHDDDALFVWRKFIDDSGQTGVNCAVFRNESRHVSSEMILDAEKWAVERWPTDRLYTYVNADRIKSTNPGYCFKRAGWTSAGRTRGGLVVLEKQPHVDCRECGNTTPTDVTNCETCGVPREGSRLHEYEWRRY